MHCESAQSSTPNGSLAPSVRSTTTTAEGLCLLDSILLSDDMSMQSELREWFVMLWQRRASGALVLSDSGLGYTVLCTDPGASSES